MTAVLYYTFVGLALLLALALGFVWGRWDRQEELRRTFNRRRYLRRHEEQIMADLSALREQMGRLIALATAPRAEDPAIQAEIDRLAAEAKAAADQASPPA